jgi:hypothetical protein
MIFHSYCERQQDATEVEKHHEKVKKAMCDNYETCNKYQILYFISFLTFWVKRVRLLTVLQNLLGNTKC